MIGCARAHTNASRSASVAVCRDAMQIQSCRALARGLPILEFHSITITNAALALALRELAYDVRSTVLHITVGFAKAETLLGHLSVTTSGIYETAATSRKWSHQ